MEIQDQVGNHEAYQRQYHFRVHSRVGNHTECIELALSRDFCHEGRGEILLDGAGRQYVEKAGRRQFDTSVKPGSKDLH